MRAVAVLLFLATAGEAAADCGADALGELSRSTFEAFIDAELVFLDQDINAYVFNVPGIPGACTPEFASRWRKAMRCARDKAESCAGHLNPSLTGPAMEAFTGSLGRVPLAISCNLHFQPPACMPLAVTHVPTAVTARFGLKRQVLDESVLSLQSDEKLCAAALHEAFHWSGRRHRTPDGDGGKDAIYACGRYCGGKCQGGPAAGMADCLACAETQERKVMCGQTLEVFTAAPWKPPDRDACGFKKACGQVRYARILACDMTVLGVPIGTPPGAPGHVMCCENCCEPVVLPVGKYPCEEPAPECFEWKEPQRPPLN